MPPFSELTIEYLTQVRADKDHPRHRSLRLLEKKLESSGFDFAIYRELFERYVGEGVIATGGFSAPGTSKGLVEIRELAIGPKHPTEINPIEEALGQHPRQEERYLDLSSFFEQYDKTPTELFFQKKLYLETRYFKKEIIPNSKQNLKRSLRLLSSLTGRDPLERIARERVAMLENFRNSGGLLVSNSKSSKPSGHLRYYDLPWAIDYFGYVKERDGAHRRATLYYLGHQSIPTLVLNFKKIDTQVVEATTENKILRENFSKFRAMVLGTVKTNTEI